MSEPTRIGHSAEEALEASNRDEASESLTTCPRCSTPADHSPDDKVCSDHCITRYQAALRTALAEREGLKARRDTLVELAYTDPREQNHPWRDAYKDAHQGNVELSARVEKAEAQLAALMPALHTLIQQWRDEVVRRSVHGNPLKWSEADGIRWCADALLALVPDL